MPDLSLNSLERSASGKGEEGEKWTVICERGGAGNPVKGEGVK